MKSYNNCKRLQNSSLQITPQTWACGSVLSNEQVSSFSLAPLMYVYSSFLIVKFDRFGCSFAMDGLSFIYQYLQFSGYKIEVRDEKTIEHDFVPNILVHGVT